jgi:hypothetical protein
MKKQNKIKVLCRSVKAWIGAVLLVAGFVTLIHSIDGRYEKTSSAQEYKTQQAQVNEKHDKKLYELDLTQKQFRDLDRMNYLDRKINEMIEKYKAFEKMPSDEIKKKYLELQAERNYLDKKIRKEVYEDAK